MKQIPENVYRFPYEFISILTILISNFILIFLPIPLLIILMTLIILDIILLIRLYQGLRINKFRKAVKKLPIYSLTAAEIPVSKKALFIGRGFLWTQKHTQRLMIVRNNEYQFLLDQSNLYKKIRNYELKHDNFITKLTSSSSIFNPLSPMPPVGGSSEIHGIETKETDIFYNIQERFGHTVVLGTTRVGKTRLAETLITQDIARGDVVIVFDPKGDSELLIKMYTEATKANKMFYMFHLGFPQISCCYNPIADYGRITEVATRIASQLPSEGQSNAFRDFVWRFVNVLAKTMEALSIKPTYLNIYKWGLNIDELASQYFRLIIKLNGLEQDLNNFELNEEDKKSATKKGRDISTMHLASYIKDKNISNSLFNALLGILSNDRSYFEKLVSSLYPLLEKLTTGAVAQLLSPDLSNLSDDCLIMDWKKVIESEAVVYVGLDSLSDYEVAGAVGNAMFADLTSLAGQIYKYGYGAGQSKKSAKKRVVIHADEFNELIGDEFIPLLNKAGGAGYQVTVYTQTWDDVEAKTESAPKARQIAGNLNNMIMLRVKTKETASMLVNQLPKIKVYNSTISSSVNDMSQYDQIEDFSTRNEDKISTETVPLIDEADLIALPKGQAFALLEGSKLYKIRLPLPKNDFNLNIPKNIEEVAKKMRQKIHLNPVENEKDIFVTGKKYEN